MLSTVLCLSGFTPAHAAVNDAAQEKTPSEGDKAWQEVSKALRPPVPPAEWANKPPTAEEKEKFLEQQRKLAVAALDKLDDFLKRFPDHPKAAEARTKQERMLKVAAQLGDKGSADRLEQEELKKSNDPNLSEDKRFQLRAQAVQMAAGKRRAEGTSAVLQEYEKGAKELIKDFPQQSGGYEMLFSVAENYESDKAQELAKFLMESKAPDDVKAQAKALIAKFEAIGKPVPIAFKAVVNGGDVDVAKLKGKVVLIDFWATWCGPCVGEVPHVVEAYEKLHPKGFEIVGISFDQEKDALVKFVAEKKMSWPQYFDGLGWNNKFGKQFGVQSIPAMWLIDKKGNLRDLNARGDLESKVEKLLAE